MVEELSCFLTSDGRSRGPTLAACIISKQMHAAFGRWRLNLNQASLQSRVERMYPH
jgi:hypothetical protein